MHEQRAMPARMAADAAARNIGRMKKELWHRLTRYHFDQLVPPHLADHVMAAFGGADASTKAFASKLARKLGWTTVFSVRAIGEYKKFVYLGVVSDISVTPPKVIDQVWHEHLLFTRAYRDFCRDVLGREFDHHPELVPSNDQTDVFQAQYVATLHRYRIEFNAEPPADIWGTPKFTTSAVHRNNRPPKQNDGGSASRASYEETPLFLLVGGTANDGGHAPKDASEFGGGGGFAGGGGGGSWSGDSPPDGHSGHGGEAGASSSGGSDSGSSCSSSCGGGGGGE